MSLNNDQHFLIPIDPASNNALTSTSHKTVTVALEAVNIGGNGNAGTGITDPLLERNLLKVYRDNIKGRFFVHVFQPNSNILLNNNSLPHGMRRKLAPGDILSMRNSAGVEYKYRFEKPGANNFASARVATKAKKDPEANITSSKFPTELRENISCSICFDIMFRPKTMVPCGHSYCMECSDGQTKCPLCNADVKSQVTCFSLQSLVELVMDGSSKTDGVPIPKDYVDQYKKRKGGEVGAVGAAKLSRK